MDIYSVYTNISSTSSVCVRLKWDSHFSSEKTTMGSDSKMAGEHMAGLSFMLYAQ